MTAHDNSATRASFPEQADQHQEQSAAAIIRHAIEHLEHVLPGQGPILDFVHHNTIHGFQHLPFLEALSAYEQLTGISGFLPEARSRHFYRSGRITDRDLDGVLNADAQLDAGAVVCRIGGQTLTRKQVYRAALLHDLPALQPAQLQWQLANGGLETAQPGTRPDATAALQTGHASLPAALAALWRELCATLGVPAAFMHPEEVAQRPLHLQAALPKHASAQPAFATTAEAVFAKVGNEWSLRTLVLALTGSDILDTVRPQLIRLGGSLLDEGLAAWHITGSEETSLYQAWRRRAMHDPQLALLELDGTTRLLRQLPESAEAALEHLLLALGIPRARWAGYLQRCALELPGWMGMINWRQRRPGYRTDNPSLPRLEDYLAIRLALDHLVLEQLCHEVWNCAGNYPGLLAWFEHHPAELQGRLLLHAGSLPEHLTREAEALCIRPGAPANGHGGWERLHARVHAWQQAAVLPDAATLPGSEATAGEDQAARAARAWQLFCLCQHLGLSAADIRQGTAANLEALHAVLAGFGPGQHGRVWLQAFENNYRDAVFAGLRANHARGFWLRRDQRAEAQIVMCMDEREESFRRHLEEINPRIETFGAAGFFGVPMQYQGLDNHHDTPLCPIIVTPASKVVEIPRPGQDEALTAHRRGWRLLEQTVSLLYQRLRFNPLLAWVFMLVAAPFVLLGMLLEAFFPDPMLSLRQRLRQLLVRKVATQLTLNEQDAAGIDTAPLKPGFSDAEQVTRIGGLLRALGLTRNFAPLVVLAGHGSTSRNNPHGAAYDCGACGGRKGGPNARAFAAMANRPEIRELLAAQNIHIPDDCWFVGIQHDTCNEELTWYDTDLVPEPLQQRLVDFQDCMAQAQQRSAHERCRRFFAAVGIRSNSEAYRHVVRRSQDKSQVQPEFGHSTIASAIIGRRQLSQGVFMDRRVFLISYDPTGDADGRIIENILMTAGPVGAGINLEYYFSTVDNDRFGCGTKTPHNVTGLVAVMEGACGDLRTGLPLQMVEIHEAMRLQVMVEAHTHVLERIYGDQPELQELIGGGWLLLSAINPDTGAISVFEQGKGFVPWQQAMPPLAQQAQSRDCYAGRHAPVEPQLIRQPDLAGA